MKFSFFSSKLLVALTLMFFTFSCGKDEPATMGGEAEGDFSVEMTDAPLDDANVQAVFVTVADVRVDGQSLEGFSSTTVEISALTNGMTETLFDGKLAADSYSKLEIVLEDGLTAVNGGPGCYVLNENNEKVALEAANDGVITLQNSNFTVAENSSVAAVVDFDLRKALVRADDESKPYRFAAESRLDQSLRFVTKERSGTLTGKITNDTEEEGEIVVYAYTKGTYQASEAEGSSDDELFLNAVSSTRVASDMTYKLSFLQEGQYELVAVSYKDSDADGQVEMQGNFQLSTTGGLNLLGLSVQGESTTTANFTLGAFRN